MWLLKKLPLVIRMMFSSNSSNSSNTNVKDVYVLLEREDRTTDDSRILNYVPVGYTRDVLVANRFYDSDRENHWFLYIPDKEFKEGVNSWQNQSTQ